MADNRGKTTVRGCDLGHDPVLIEQGWEWRCNTDDIRARDIVENYEALGFEVTLAPMVLDDLDEDCTGCMAVLSQINAVYVRRRSHRHSSEERSPAPQ